MQDIKAEIIVIGGGGGGLTAAVAAAELGKKVVVLEKRASAGGNTVFAEGLFAAESPAQKRLAIDARKDDLFRIALDYAHWKINASVVRAFVDKSGDTIRWLEEKGLRFDWIPPFASNQLLRVWHCPEKGGPSIVKALVKRSEDLGVQIIFNAAVEKIDVDKSGCVCGARATINGETVRINARAVIVATGGFGGNKELLKKNCPTWSEEYMYNGLPHMGDGIAMATSLGAATEGMGMIQISGPSFPKSELCTELLREPNTIMINKRGERFFNEAVCFNGFESVNAIMRQPNKLAYILIDDSIVHNIKQNGYVRIFLGILYGRKIGPVPNLVEELEKQVERGLVKISDSLDEIAAWIGARQEILKATVHEYNSFCDDGYDAAFAKERRYLNPLRNPPYYAVRSFIHFMTTLGGVKTTNKMEAVDQAGNTIPGLFMVGNDIGGWESDTYCALLPGSTLGFAINSGRIAAETAAKYISA